jgi:hypothetical protein
MRFSNGCILFWNIRHASSYNWCFVRSKIPVIYCLQLLSVFINPSVRVLTFRREVAEASVLLACDAVSHDNCIPAFRRNVPPSSSGWREQITEWRCVMSQKNGSSNPSVHPSRYSFLWRYRQIATEGRMLLREHPLVNAWRKFSPFQGLCQHTENTNSAVPGVVLEPTVPGFVSRAAAAMLSALSQSVMLNMYDHTRPEV